MRERLREMRGEEGEVERDERRRGRTTCGRESQETKKNPNSCLLIFFYYYIAAVPIKNRNNI